MKRPQQQTTPKPKRTGPSVFKKFFDALVVGLLAGSVALFLKHVTLPSSRDITTFFKCYPINSSTVPSHVCPTISSTSEEMQDLFNLLACDHVNQVQQYITFINDCVIPENNAEILTLLVTNLAAIDTQTSIPSHIHEILIELLQKVILLQEEEQNNNKVTEQLILHRLLLTNTYWENGQYNQSVVVGQELLTDLERMILLPDIKRKSQTIKSHSKNEKRKRNRHPGYQEEEEQEIQLDLQVWHISMVTNLAERLSWIGQETLPSLLLADKWIHLYTPKTSALRASMETHVVTELIINYCRIARVWMQLQKGIEQQETTATDRTDRTDRTDSAQFSYTIAQELSLLFQTWMSMDQKLNVQASMKSTKILLRSQSYALKIIQNKVPVPQSDYTVPEQTERWYQSGVQQDALNNWDDTKVANENVKETSVKSRRCDFDQRKYLSSNDFEKQYVLPGAPVVLDGLIDEWPARTKWTKSALTMHYGDIKVLISTSGDKIVSENIYPTVSSFSSFFGKTITSESISLQSYIEDYLNQNNDNRSRPLYLFKKRNPLGAKLNNDYTHSKHFQEKSNGMFDYPQQRRNQNAIFYLGSNGSGTGFHRHSAAYNALLFGRKRWYLLPPNVPTVHDDDLETTWSEKISITNNLPIQPLICEQLPGEIVYVPDGWQHAVLNLETSVGVAIEIGSDVARDGVEEE